MPENRGGGREIKKLWNEFSKGCATIVKKNRVPTIL